MRYPFQLGVKDARYGAGPHLSGLELGLGLRDPFDDDREIAAWSSHGYYQKSPAKPLLAGDSHILKISHPTAFDPIEVSLTVPSGPPEAITIDSPPTSWTTPLDTTMVRHFIVRPVSGSWDSSGTVVWATAYDLFYAAQVHFANEPTGTQALDCAIPTGKGALVGFDVRKRASCTIPGSTPDSFFRIEGAVVAQYGFHPGLLPSATLNLDIVDDGQSTVALAGFWDSSASVARVPVSIIVDNVALVAESEGSPNFRSNWPTGHFTEGQSIAYSFEDAAHNKRSGTFAWHAVPLVLPASVPLNAAAITAGTTEISFPAPTSGWADGSRIFYSVMNASGNSRTAGSVRGYGNSPIVITQSVDFPFFGSPQLKIWGAMETRYPIDTYLGSVKTTGPGVSW
jgi:hypothetical protein